MLVKGNKCTILTMLSKTGFVIGFQSLFSESGSRLINKNNGEIQ